MTKWMFKLWVPGLLIAVSVVVAQGYRIRTATQRIEPAVNQEALVYIAAIDFQGGTLSYKGLRVGFAVGDGRYVVTAAHCLQDIKNTHDSLGFAWVISPYYGDLVAAEIVAVDAPSDIAVLRPAWERHPALELQVGDQWKKNAKIDIVGYPPPVPEYGGGNTISAVAMTESTRLVGSTGPGSCRIRVGPVRFAGPGWSGSPFILPETGHVIGVLSSREEQKEWLLFNRRYILGPDVTQIRQVFEDHTLELPPDPLPLESENSDEVFQQMLVLFDKLTSDQAQALVQIRRLCQQRPESYALHILAGWMVDDADLKFQYRQRAIEIASHTTVGNVVYSSLHSFANLFYIALVQSGHEGERWAAECFEQAAGRDPDNLFAQHGRLHTLIKSDPNTAVTLAETLLERWPQNANFWFEYGRVLRQQERHLEELPAFQKAIELTPAESVPYWFQRYLADSLAANGLLDDAEQAYQTLLDMHFCDRCRGAYANFLDKTGRPQEAELVRTYSPPEKICTP